MTSLELQQILSLDHCITHSGFKGLKESQIWVKCLHGVYTRGEVKNKIKKDLAPLAFVTGASSRKQVLGIPLLPGLHTVESMKLDSPTNNNCHVFRQ